MSNNISGGGRSSSSTHHLPAVLLLPKVVEYLESSMSRDLLCKFPDNSALGFDYAQSSIWSPLLLPRSRSRPPNAIDYHPRGLLHISTTHLSFHDDDDDDDDDDDGMGNTCMKMASGIKRKFTDTVIHNVGGGGMKMKRRKKRKSSSAPKAQAWTNNFMKAAANYFRRRNSSSNHFAVVVGH